MTALNPHMMADDDKTPDGDQGVLTETKPKTAKPPLYKVKKGKQERYLTDDGELGAYFMEVAVNDVEIDLGDTVATGEHWYGTRALELGLADEILTSDELLLQRAADRDLYRVSYKIKQPLQKRIMHNIDGAIEKVDAASWRRRFESRLPRSPWN